MSLFKALTKSGVPPFMSAMDALDANQAAALVANTFPYKVVIRNLSAVV